MDVTEKQRSSNRFQSCTVASLCLSIGILVALMLCMAHGVDVPLLVDIPSEESEALLAQIALIAMVLALPQILRGRRTIGLIALLVGLLVRTVLPNVYEAAQRSDRATMACQFRQRAMLGALEMDRMDVDRGATPDRVRLEKLVKTQPLVDTLKWTGRPPFDRRRCLDQLRNTGIYCLEHRRFSAYTGTAPSEVIRDGKIPP